MSTAASYSFPPCEVGLDLPTCPHEKQFVTGQSAKRKVAARTNGQSFSVWHSPVVFGTFDFGRTEWMEPYAEFAVDMMPVPGPKIGAIKRVGKATGVEWKLLKVGRPLKKMGHAAKHLKEFQKIDPSLSAGDVAKILKYVRQGRSQYFSRTSGGITELRNASSVPITLTIPYQNIMSNVEVRDLI